MPSFVWAKLWIETLDDPKLGFLSDHLWRRFFELVLVAKECNAGGCLPGVRNLAWRLRCTLEEITADLEALAVEELQLVTNDGHGWKVTNFVKRQETAMDSAERMRRLRERERHAAYAEDATEPEQQDDDVTESDATRDVAVTSRHTEEKRGDIKEEEEEVELPPPPTIPPPPPTARPPPLTKDEIQHLQANPTPELCEAWPFFCMTYEMAYRTVYEQWIKPLVPLRLEDSTVLLGAPNIYVEEWCRERLKKPICEYLNGALGKRVDVTFAVLPPPGGT